MPQDEAWSLGTSKRELQGEITNARVGSPQNPQKHLEEKETKGYIQRHQSYKAFPAIDLTSFHGSFLEESEALVLKLRKGRYQQGGGE